MASDLVDGDYLGSYRRFIVDFLDKVNPDDQLPIKTSGHDVSEGEMVGEIIHMTLQYLNQQLCPPSLQCYIVKLVIEEIKATCRKQPESCGFRQEEKSYAPLKLMQAVASKVNEICQRYLENSRLALLPPPPSSPMPLANAFAIRNNRRKMEDRHVILHDLNTIFNIKDDSIASYYAVFDGHAGYQAAVFCAVHLHQYLTESRYYPTDPERALRDAFLITDDIFVQKSTRQTLSSGTTAVCALILKRKLYVAWVGDSQAALAKRGVVTQLVNPHKPDRNDERERVEQMGGTVMHLGIWRVNGNLAVSRAIGDAQYKPYVTGDPEIRCITLDGDEDFLIIGCDGLWDCVTENEAAALVYRDLYRNPYNYESASQRLVEYAKSQGSIDNITVIVVFLASPSKIASRSTHYGNPLLADVQLDNMEPDNRYLSNANGQFDLNSAFVKQTSTNNGSPDLMDDEDPYGNYANKSSNGKHRENGGRAVESADYDAEEDDEDLGPETDVDALDDVSEPLPTLADVSRQLFPEKQDPCELYQSEEQIDDETPPSPEVTKTNQQALIPETDNVGDSEDSEDEWNYYRIDPNKEKESAGAAGFSPKTKADNETREDIAEAASSPIEHRDLLGDEKNESDSSSEPDSEREIRSNALVDNEISADTKFGLIPPSTTEEKVDREETEKFETEKEAEKFDLEEEQDEKKDHEEEQGEKVEKKDHEEQEDEKKDYEEDMDFQLNPNAAEFIPVSPTPIIPTRMELDAPIAGSPLKQTPVMDDITIPSRREFENEVRNRPCEIEEKSECTNGQLLAELDECVLQKQPSATSIFNPDESEVSSTKAEFGDESSFLTASEFQRTGLSNIDGSFADSYSGFDDSAVDPMTKSFGPGDFMALGNPVDLNAVHDLTDDDLMPDENEAQDIIEEEEKMNLENIQAFEANTGSVESQNKEEMSIDPFSTHQTANILDSSSPVSSPSSPVHEVDFGSEITENRVESPDSTVLEAEKVAKEEEKSLDDVEISSPSSQPLYDETSVTSKLLEMDLEDRGSQDCGFEKCNEKFAPEGENPPRIDEVADFLSSPVPRDDFVTSPVPESLPVESPQVEEVDKIAESLKNLHAVIDSSTHSTAAPEVPILLNPLDLQFESKQTRQDDAGFEDIPDYHVAKASDSPTIDILSPLAQNDEHKRNPFESADFGSPISFGDPQDKEPNLQDFEVKHEIDELEIVKIQPEVEEHQPKIEEPQPEIVEPQQEIKELQSEIVEPQPEIVEPQPEIVEPQPEIVELRPEIKEVQPEIKEVQPEVEEPQPEVEEFQPEVDEPQPEVDEPQPEVDEPQPEIVEPQQEIVEPQQEIKDLQPEIDEPQLEMEEPKPEIKEPQPEVVEPQREIEEPQPEIEELQPKIEEPQPEIEEPQPKMEEPQPKIVETQSETEEPQPEINEPRETPSEIVEVTSGLKLSESLQEFTGLEEQLNPENSSKISNGLEVENFIAIPREESKIDLIIRTEIAEPAELIKEESTKEPLEEEKKMEIPIAVEPAKIEKEEVVAAASVAAIATAAAAGTVAAAVATKATKAKPTAAKTTTKSATSTKPSSNKSTPTSPTKPAVTARTSSLTAAKKTAPTTSAARPTKLETGKAAPAASKPSASATKSTTPAPKTTGRLGVASPRTKPATSSISKTSSSSAEKKPTTNGDATKSSLTSSKVSSTAAKAPSKPLVKPSTTRATSATTTTTATTARARATSTAATSTLAKTQSKTTTGNVGTTTQRPKTAPTGGATTLATKSRLTSTTKSPITEKQIKETANKQISSSRTSTTTTASKTSRTSVSSSTTTTTRRAAASKTTSSTTSAVTPAVPPPIRKPAPITRPGGKTITAAATAAAPPTTNGKTHVTKTTATNKTKVVIQNGVCTAEQESKIVTSTTNNEDEDVPKKDLSPVEPSTDNQLIIAAD